MADGQQSPRMRTRAQGRTSHNQPGAEQTRATDGGSSGDIYIEHEKSSLNTADYPTQADRGFPNVEEPVTAITDQRIKTLLAKTDMEKMMLDNSRKDLNKQAERHKGYQEDGEDSHFLVDRAVQLKRNVNKAE